MCLTEYNEAETLELFKEEYLVEGKISALLDLVKDGLISVAEAAKRLGMTEEAFLSEMK